MKLIDEMNRLKPEDFGDHGMLGIVQVERIYKDGRVVVEDELKNLVLNGSATILRDLMFGDNSQRISKIHFGDMGLTESSDLKNVAPPQPTDTKLARKLYEKSTSKVQGTYNGYPCIIYTVTLIETEFNGPTGQQLITEYALATDTDALFTRKTRAAIYKDSESSLKFTWTLVFN